MSLPATKRLRSKRELNPSEGIETSEDKMKLAWCAFGEENSRLVERDRPRSEGSQRKQNAGRREIDTPSSRRSKTWNRRRGKRKSMPRRSYEWREEELRLPRKIVHFFAVAGRRGMHVERNPGNRGERRLNV